MRFKKTLLFIPLLSLVITGCDTSGPAPDSKEVDTTFYFIFGNNMDTKAHFSYKNDYFRVPATTFNKDLAVMSFVAAANSGQKKEMKKFYKSIDFGDQYYTEVYDKGCGVDTYGFALASREVDDFTLLSLSFRSYDYTLEWVSNVTLGENGNHAGFDYATDNALVEFNKVVSEKYAGKKLKLWVNGFSRGGAEANMFTTKLLNHNDFGFDQTNVYCYTFEAPAGFNAENVRKDYKNIFNLANSGDIVVNVPPEQYGLYRSGIDIDTLRDDFDKLYADYMHELYPEPVLDEETGEMVDKAQEYIDMIPAFEPYTGSKDKEKNYENESEFMDVMIQRILDTDDPNYGIQDRANYVAHVQTAAQFGMRLFYSIDQFAMYYVINDFRNRFLDSYAHMLRLAGLVMQEDGLGLYEIAKTYLDFIEFEYSDEELKATCKTLYKVVTEIGFNDVMSIINALPNIQRALYFHWHESTFVLVRALEYNPAQEQEGEKL